MNQHIETIPGSILYNEFRTGSYEYILHEGGKEFKVPCLYRTKNSAGLHDVDPLFLDNTAKLLRR